MKELPEGWEYNHKSECYEFDFAQFQLVVYVADRDEGKSISVSLQCPYNFDVQKGDVIDDNILLKAQEICKLWMDEGKQELKFKNII